VLDFTPGPARILDGTEGAAPGETVYVTPAREFRLSRLAATSRPRDMGHPGPQIVLVVDGSATVTAGGRRIEIRRGPSVWISAADADARLTGEGTVFRATDGL
jgi:mannose-6-phosphate isomerase